MPSALLALCVTTLFVVTLAEPPLNIGLGDLGIGDGSYSSSGSGSSEINSAYGAPGGFDLSGYKDGPPPSLSGYSDGTGFGSSSGGFGSSGGYGGGEGIVAAPSGKGVRYAGPIVYTNEKPPVIHFPPPPKPKKGGKGGYGKSKGHKAHSIKYVPLPHHDLPILIYQSDINPPIHVVHPPAGSQIQNSYGSPPPLSDSYSVPPNSEYGLPQSSHSVSSSVSSSSFTAPKIIHGASSVSSSTTYSSPQGSVPAAPALPASDYSAASSFQSSSSHLTSEYSVPQSQPLGEYGPPQQQQLNQEYGPPIQQQQQIVQEYGPPKITQEYGPPKAAKAQPLPHIIYTGHPPIHIFQQPPIYMSAPAKASSYSVSHSSKGHSSKGHSKGHSSKGHSGHSSQSLGGGSHFGSFGSHFGSFGSSFGLGGGKASGSKAHSTYSSSSHGHGHGSSSKGKGSSAPFISFSFGSPPSSGSGSKGHHHHAKGEYGSASSSSSSHSHSHSHSGGGGGGGKGLNFGKSFSFNFPSFKSLHNHLGLHSSGSGSGSGWGAPPQKARSVGGSGWGSSKSSKSYVVAPKAWNKPPIIIYQGVRPPVHVYEKPSGGYVDAGSALSGGYSSGSAFSGGYSSGSAPTVLSPVDIVQSPSTLTLAQPSVSASHGHSGHSELAHVAGTDKAGNPAAANVDLTYQIARISAAEAGQFLDPRFNNPYAAQSRSIYIQQPQQTVLAQPTYYTGSLSNQPAALYVSDLTSAGQQYQILRRSDILDQNILFGLTEQLKAANQQQQQQQQQLDQAAQLQLAAQVAPTATVETTSTTQQQQEQQAQAQVSEEPTTIQARMDVLPTFLSNVQDGEQSLNIPASYSSVIIQSAQTTLENRSGEPATVSAAESESESSSASSSPISEVVSENPTESESKSS